MDDPSEDSEVCSEFAGAAQALQRPSASWIASRPTEFSRWKEGADVVFFESPSDPAPEVLFRRLCAIKLPKDIVQFLEDVKRRDHFLKHEVQLADGIQVWARNNPESIALDDTDECDIKKSFDHVLGPAFARACSTTVLKKELAQRRAIDELIQAVFSGDFREGARTEIEYEVIIRLRRSANIAIDKATANTLVVHPLLDRIKDIRLRLAISKAVMLFNDPEAQSLRSRSYSDFVSETLKTVLFAMEVERQSSETSGNQLCFDLCTAQSQRRALGLQDDVIFGGVFVDGRFSIYSSYWMESLTFVDFQGEFNLRDPMGLIGCWFFLRRLHDYACDRAEEEGQTFDIEKAIQSIRENQWRAESQEGTDANEDFGEREDESNANAGARLNTRSLRGLPGSKENLTERIVGWLEEQDTRESVMQTTIDD